MVGEGFGNQRQLDPGLKPFIRICQSFVREVDRCSGIRKEQTKSVQKCF